MFTNGAFNNYVDKMSVFVHSFILLIMKVPIKTNITIKNFSGISIKKHNKILHPMII